MVQHLEAVSKSPRERLRLKARRGATSRVTHGEDNPVIQEKCIGESTMKIWWFNQIVGKLVQKWGVGIDVPRFHITQLLRMFHLNRYLVWWCSKQIPNSRDIYQPLTNGGFSECGVPNSHLLHVWYLHLQNWVILFGQMLVNIPAPWSIWDCHHDTMVVFRNARHLDDVGSPNLGKLGIHDESFCGSLRQWSAPTPKSQLATCCR